MMFNTNYNNNLYLQEIYTAKKRIQNYIHHTQLLESKYLTNQLPFSVFMKTENSQVVGSFKIRGAANKILYMAHKEKLAGVVTVSSGNHGRAVAYMANQLGIKAIVCLSKGVKQNKVDSIKSIGAEVHICGETSDEATEYAEKLSYHENLPLIHPFDDPYVIAGQGTIGLEILEDLPNVQTVVVPFSGGGLIAGVGLAIKTVNPNIKVVGVTFDRAPVMYHSLRAGKILELKEEETIADALVGGLGNVNNWTFAMMQKYVDQTITVSDDSIKDAMRFLFRENKLVIEGGGVVGVAALIENLIPCEPNDNVVVILSGSNIDSEKFLNLMNS